MIPVQEKDDLEDDNDQSGVSSWNFKRRRVDESIEIQWRQYVFDPLANYENWLLVEVGTEYKFTCLFM